MNLEQLMVDTKHAWVSYPGLDGFEVEIVNLGREKLVALRKGCVEPVFDRKTKVRHDELNEKKFLREFTAATVKDWKGLTLDYLEQLMLVDISGQNPDEEVAFTPENALLLVTNSGDFDTWLNEVVFDLDNFRSKRNTENVGKTGAVSE